MGRTKVNQLEVVTPMPRMKVAELKELALVPATDKLYDKSGRVLRDDEFVTTDEAEYGAVTDWTRGAETRGKPWERCAICGKPFREGEEPAYEFDTGEEPGPLAAHEECLPADS